MNTDFKRQLEADGATLEQGMPRSFGDPAGELARLAAGPAVACLPDRTRTVLTGADRASWLHNLTTNEIRNLQPGEGNYTFVLNVQGRILFDAHVLVGADSMWLDIHAKFAAPARAHFDKYTIVEDVRLETGSPAPVRLGLFGREAGPVFDALDASNAAVLPRCGWMEVKWRETVIRLHRDDSGGPSCWGLWVPADAAADFWRWLVEHGAVPVGLTAIDVHRIELGIPWPGQEITDEYVPAETGQLERAVSFQKGCYLGQEIVARMHSRGSLARQMVRLAFPDGVSVEPGATLTSPDGKAVGTVTSVRGVPSTGRVIGLGYLRSAALGQPVLAGESGVSVTLRKDG